MEQTQKSKVVLVRYSTELASCPQCGYRSGSGMETIRVASVESAIERKGDQLIVHGIEGDAIFPEARVSFIRFKDEDGDGRRSRNR